jgi:hypothetical protein
MLTISARHSSFGPSHKYMTDETSPMSVSVIRMWATVINRPSFYGGSMAADAAGLHERQRFRLSP